MTGTELREIRKTGGLKQSELADALNKELGIKGYNKVIISHIECGLADLPKNAESTVASICGYNRPNSPSDERKAVDKVIMPTAEKKSPKTAIPNNWHDKGLKQTERILGWLNENKSITTKEAFDYLGIARLASRIHDLKEEGYEFNTEWETGKNRFGKSASYTRYSFKGVDDGKENVDRLGSLE